MCRGVLWWLGQNRGLSVVFPADITTIFEILDLVFITALQGGKETANGASKINQSTRSSNWTLSNGFGNMQKL
jgi:hypothetical protein